MEKKPSGVDRKYLLFAFRIVGDFGLVIVVPVVLLVLGGKYLDSRFETSPWFTLLAFALSALCSGVAIYRKAKAYGKEFMSLDKEKTEKK